MSHPPADRKAKRRASGIEPNAERQRLAAVFANLAPTQHFLAADIVSAWPRLIHQLALQGELAAPRFDTI